MNHRSRSPLKKEPLKRPPMPIYRRRKASIDEVRQVTHAFKEFVAHGANVNCLSLGHKSGRVLVTGGDDRKVNLWAVGKPNCILSLSGHSTAVECVRFGGSEDLVCAGSLSGALKIWDLEATKIVRTLTGHKSNIRSIDFHPYGDFICTGSLDTNIKLWDIKRKGCIFTYKGHNLTVNSLKFSPDGQWIASAGEDCAVKLWDLRAGKMLTEFSSHTGPVSDVEFHPHEFLLASASHDRTVNFWDLEKFSLVSASDADTGPIRTIAFHPDGKCIYAGATDVLKVYGWEPSRSFDSVAMGWGKVQDIAIAQNQLIGATFHGAYVSLYVIDLKRVQPFCGAEKESSEAAFQPNSTIRKSFILNHKSGKANCESIKTEEASDTGGDDAPEDDPPPEIVNMNDYRDIFNTHRELQRTPPPLTMPPANNNDNTLLRRPSCLKDPVIEQLPKVSPSSKVFPSSVYSRLSSQRFDSNSNLSASNDDSPPPCSDFSSGKKPPPSFVSNQHVSSPPIRDSPVPTSNGISSQSYRSRAVSESRREVQYTGSVSSDQDSRYNIRHSPSEPHLVRQSSSPGPGPPTSSSPPVQPNSPVFLHLSQPDSQTGFQTRTLERPTPRHMMRNLQTGGSDSDLRYQGGSQMQRPLSPKISYLGTPKEPPECPKYSESLCGYISPYSLPFDRKVSDLDDLLSRNLSQKFSSAVTLGTGIVGNEVSEQEVINSLIRGHSTMTSTIIQRTRGLQVIRRLWQSKDLRTAVEHTLNTGDQAVLIDFLSVVNLRPSIWNLDILTLLLPPVSLLLQSENESYVACGCETLKLMLKNFASVIQSNMMGPIHSVGVDISREERYKKCVECYNHMMSIRMFILKKQTLPGKLGHAFRELIIMMQHFD